MRSRFAVSTVAALVVAVAGAGIASATASSGGDTHGRTFTVFSKTVQFAAIDLGDSGPSLGDQFVFSDDLFTENGGSNVGSDGGVCTTVRHEKSGTDTVQCAVTFSFEGGQIATQALLTVENGAFSGSQTGPVTGGSGAFRGARGEVTVKFLSADTADITFALDD